MTAVAIVGALLLAGQGIHPERWFLPIVFIAVVPAALSIVLFTTELPGAHKTALFLTSIALLCICGLLMLQRQTLERQFWGILPERVTMVTGVMVEDGGTGTGGKVRIILSLEQVEDWYGNRAEATGRLTAFCEGPSVPELGSLVRLKLGLFLPEDGDSRSGYLGYGLSNPEILSPPPTVFRHRAGVFDFIHTRIRSIGKKSPDLLEALLLGYKSGGSEKLYDLFRRSGNAHLLALSGMHLGIITLGVMWLLVPLFGRGRAVLVSLVLIVVYLGLVGPRPSLVRAVLMYGLGSFGFLFFGRRPCLFHLLVMTFVVQSLFFPDTAYSLGFQLSYLALAGIILWSGTIEGAIPFWVPPTARKVVAAGLSAQLCTSFLLVKVFGVLYPFGILSVLLLSPFIVLWMWAGISYILWTLLMDAFPGTGMVMLDLLFRRILEAMAELTFSLTELCASFPALKISSERWGWVAGLGISVLTLFTLSRYVGRYAANRKLQLTEGDSTVSHFPWNGSEPPIWAEFPDFTGDTGEDHRAA